MAGKAAGVARPSPSGDSCPSPFGAGSNGGGAESDDPIYARAGAAIPPGAAVRAFPAVERHRWVWVWTGEPAKADPVLLEAFRSGEDIHRRTAAEVFGVAADAVGRVLRGVGGDFPLGGLEQVDVEAIGEPHEEPEHVSEFLGRAAAPIGVG